MFHTLLKTTKVLSGGQMRKTQNEKKKKDSKWKNTVTEKHSCNVKQAEGITSVTYG